MPHKYTLTLGEPSRIGGRDRHDGDVYKYDVRGMPAGEKGEVGIKHDHGWKADSKDQRWSWRRIRSDKVGAWTGDYGSAAGALVALQHEIDGEHGT